eukprot:12534-Heterococcus_DN1.PRE.1
MRDSSSHAAGFIIGHLIDFAPLQQGVEGGIAAAAAGDQQNDHYYAGSQYESQQYATTVPTASTPIAGQQPTIQQQQPMIAQQQQHQQQQQRQQQLYQQSTKTNQWKDDYDDSDEDSDDNDISYSNSNKNRQYKGPSSYSTRSQGTAIRMTKATANIVTKAMTAPFKLIRLPRRSRASSYNGYTATTPATRTILRGSTDTNTASRYKGKAKSDSTVVKGTGSKEHVLCIAIAILKGAIPAISAMIIASLVDQIVDIKATQYVVTLAYLQELRGVCYTAAAIATAILALSATAEWIMRHILQPRLLAHTATANYKALMRAVVTHSLLKVPSIPEASELVRSHYNKAISNMQLVESITSLLSVIG